MKIIMMFWITISVFFAHADTCINIYGLGKVCVGDTVYKGSTFHQGAIVETIDLDSKSVQVKSNYLGMRSTESIKDLHLDNTCDMDFCTGDTIYLGSKYFTGAKILGINKLTKMATVRRKGGGFMNTHSLTELYSTKNACLMNACVGDTIYYRRLYDQGAMIMGINQKLKKITVKSHKSDLVKSHKIEEVHLAKGCMDKFCVGDTVFRGGIYPKGAILLAMDLEKRQVVVKSISSGDIFLVRDISELEL
jgi:hypothetical protein